MAEDQDTTYTPFTPGGSLPPSPNPQPPSGLNPFQRASLPVPSAGYDQVTQFTGRSTVPSRRIAPLTPLYAQPTNQVNTSTQVTEQIVQNIVQNGSIETSLTGDVISASGSSAATVVGIQNKPVISTAPLNGQVLQFVGADGKWEPRGPLMISQSVNTGAQTLAASASASLSLTMAKAFMAFNINEASGRKFRLRLYSTLAAASADLSRPYTVPLNLGQQHKCILDLYIDQNVVTTPFFLSSAVIGANGDATQAATIYATLTNMDTSSQTINVTISFVPLEV